MERLLFTSLLKKPMAVTFVQSGHGLMVVIKPKINAVRKGNVLLARNVCRNSIVYNYSPQPPKGASWRSEFEVIVSLSNVINCIFSENVIAQND